MCNKTRNETTKRGTLVLINRAHTHTQSNTNIYIYMLLLPLLLYESAYDNII